jgi:capsular polysaccharide biosynthesis protein
MTKNIHQSRYAEDEIDLKEIFKILIKSKKLIISTILIFAIASIIYSLSLKPSFKTSTQLEIGYVSMTDGARELIESPSGLVSNLKVLIMKNPDGKLIHDLLISSFEDKVITLEITSRSVKQNENLLTEMITYIDERHSSLSALISDQKKHQISNEIDLIESKISFSKAKKLNENQLKQSMIEDRIAKLNSELPIIDLEIRQLETVIIQDTNNLSLLTKDDKLLSQRASISPTLEQIIFSYKSKINDLNTKKYSKILERKTLNNQLKILENITLQTDELFQLEQALKNTENELQLLMTQIQVRTQPIGNIKTDTIKPKIVSTILLGLIIGFTAGIVIVFINNFIKSFREIEE